VKELFADLESRLYSSEPEEIKLAIKAAVPEYQPYLT
jgi:hypothetical protein